MSATIAEPDDRRVVRQHVVDGVEIAVAVVGQRAIQDRLAVTLQQQVVRDLGRVASLPLRHRSHGSIGRRLVVRRITKRKDAVPFRDATRHACAVARLRDQSRTEVRLAQDRNALLER